MRQRLNINIVAGLVCLTASLPGFSFATLAHPNNNIEDICAFSPVACLERIESALAASPRSDRIKFDLLQYRYVALFNLQQIEQLHEETSQWLDRPNLPIAFAITVYIYYAKTSMVMADENISQKYADKAILLLNDMQQAFPSPMRIVELANLKMQYGQINSAFDLLIDLEKKFAHSKNAYFQMELNGNLGHITQRLEQYETSLAYWNSASYWADLFGNKQQQAVILYNTGFVYQLKHSYHQAINQYKRARELANEVHDKAKINQANFRLAQIHLKLGQKQHAKSFAQLVELHYLPLTDHDEFSEVLLEASR